MNFHEPHDPVRWLNWDDISCHAAATVTAPVCLFSLCLSPPSPSVSTTTGRPAILEASFSPFPYEFPLLYDILLIRGYFIEVPPLPDGAHYGAKKKKIKKGKKTRRLSRHVRRAGTEDRGCERRHVRAITPLQCDAITSCRPFRRCFHVSSFPFLPVGPLPPFRFSLDPAPPPLSFIVLHLHNEAKA